MADDQKKLEEAQKLANQAIKEGNDLTRAYGELLKSNLKQAGFITVAAKNTSSIITRQIQDQKQNLSTSEKLKNVTKQIEETSELISKHRKNGHTSIKKELQDNLKGLKAEKDSVNAQSKKSDIMSDLVDKARDFKKAITVGAIFAGLVSIAKKFGDSIDTIGKEFGSLSVMGKEFQTDLLLSSVEATKLGGGMGDVAAITSTLASNFGMNVDEAAKLSSKVFDTSKAIGLSADESANLFGTLTQTANLSAEQAESLAEGTFQLARQNGVAPSAVMKDIAGSAEEIASFTQDGGDNIAEAAVQARKMGLSLSTTAKIAEGLLDFESSISKEVEASVLIGKQLNFQKAREAALSGDIAKATQEVVKQVGSEADFNKLNVIQRKALADSIGVSVTEMSKLVGQSDKLSLSGAMASGNFEDLLGAEGISTISQLTNKIQALGASLVNELGPALLSVVAGMMPFVTTAGAIVKSLSDMGAIIPMVMVGLAALTVKAGIAAAASIQAAYAFVIKGSAMLPPPMNLIAIGAGVAAVGAAYAYGKAKSVSDFTSGPGGITHMSGPAGAFSLNPRDSVLATTNPIPVNDMRAGPAGSMNPGGQNMNITVRSEGISNRTIQQLVDVEFGAAPGNGLM